MDPEYIHLLPEKSKFRNLSVTIEKSNIECKAYKRRWLMLLLFAICSACSASHWIQYAIITNIATRYYSVSTMLIDWTSIIIMAMYIPLVFPASWLLQKKGLRTAVILGSFLLAVGSWIKVFSTQQDRFFVAFLGQTVIGVSQIFILGVPARLAAVWFPHRQVSTATSLGVFGNQIGIAVGFVLPPLIVEDNEDTSVTGAQFLKLHLATATVATLIFLLIFSLFQASPKLPPSNAQKLLIKSKDKCEPKQKFSASLKALLRNKDFDLLLVSYGFNIGAFYAYSTLLNQLVLSYFHGPSATEDAGGIGLTLIIGGIIGAVVWGIVLDKTHIYKGTTVLMYCLAILGMIAFTYTLEQGMLTFVYITSAFLGFFMNGYQTVGYEFGAELTYPESEATSSGLLNASGELYGVVSVIIAGVIQQEYGSFATNCTLISMLICGFLLCISINGNKLRRLEASKRTTYEICSV